MSDPTRGNTVSADRRSFLKHSTILSAGLCGLVGGMLDHKGSLQRRPNTLELQQHAVSLAFDQSAAVRGKHRMFYVGHQPQPSLHRVNLILLHQADGILDVHHQDRARDARGRGGKEGVAWDHARRT